MSIFHYNLYFWCSAFSSFQQTSAWIVHLWVDLVKSTEWCWFCAAHLIGCYSFMFIFDSKNDNVENGTKWKWFCAARQQKISLRRTETQTSLQFLVKHTCKTLTVYETHTVLCQDVLLRSCRTCGAPSIDTQ